MAGGWWSSTGHQRQRQPHLSAYLVPFCPFSILPTESMLLRRRIPSLPVLAQQLGTPSSLNSHRQTPPLMIFYYFSSLPYAHTRPSLNSITGFPPSQLIGLRPDSHSTQCFWLASVLQELRSVHNKDLPASHLLSIPKRIRPPFAHSIPCRIDRAPPSASQEIPRRGGS